MTTGGPEAARTSWTGWNVCSARAGGGGRRVLRRAVGVGECAADVQAALREPLTLISGAGFRP